jgi:hypothetical protein
MVKQAKRWSDYDMLDALQMRGDLAQARIDEMEEALLDMVGLFSADDMLLKGTHLRAALKQARAALVTCRIEAIQRSTKRNKQMFKLEELEVAREDALAACGARDAALADYEAAREAASDALDSWRDWENFYAGLKKTQVENSNDQT